MGYLAAVKPVLKDQNKAPHGRASVAADDRSRLFMSALMATIAFKMASRAANGNQSLCEKLDKSGGVVKPAEASWPQKAWPRRLQFMRQRLSHRSKNYALRS
jgi:hypothetical protein